MFYRAIIASYSVAIAVFLTACASPSEQTVSQPLKSYPEPENFVCNAPCMAVPVKDRSAGIDQVTTGRSDDDTEPHPPPVYTKTCRLVGAEMHYSSCSGPITCGGGSAGKITYFKRWVIQTVPVGYATSCDDSLFRPTVISPVNGVSADAGQHVPSIPVAQIFAPGGLTLSITSPDWLRVEGGLLSGTALNTPGVSIPVTVRAYNKNGAVESTFPLNIR